MDLKKSLTPIINDIVECKKHLEGLLDKIGPNEYGLSSGTLDWPTILGVFGILSSDMIKISKFMRERQANNLRNTVFVPKAFSEDIDAHLQSITQNRMSVFNQDLIPHVLRTKLSPDLEEKERLVMRGVREYELNKNHEKNIDQFRKLVQTCIDVLDARKRELDTTKTTVNQETYSTQETYKLASLYINGPRNQRVQQQQQSRFMM